MESLSQENASYRVRLWQDFYTPDLLELLRSWGERIAGGSGIDLPVLESERLLHPWLPRMASFNSFAVAGK